MVSYRLHACRQCDTQESWKLTIFTVLRLVNTFTVKMLKLLTFNNLKGCQNFYFLHYLKNYYFLFISLSPFLFFSFFFFFFCIIHFSISSSLLSGLFSSFSSKANHNPTSTIHNPQSQTHSPTWTNLQPNTATFWLAILHKPTTPHSPPPQTYNPTSTMPNPQPHPNKPIAKHCHALTGHPPQTHNPTLTTSTAPRPQTHNQPPPRSDWPSSIDPQPTTTTLQPAPPLLIFASTQTQNLKVSSNPKFNFFWFLLKPKLKISKFFSWGERRKWKKAKGRWKKKRERRKWDMWEKKREEKRDEMRENSEREILKYYYLSVELQ